MRLKLFLVLLLAAGGAGCDQQESKTLEFERQLEAKDKMIADLARTNSDLQQQLSKLQAGGNPEGMAETIAESVAKRIEQQQTANFGEMKVRLDEMSRLQKAAPSMAAVDSSAARGTPPAAPQPKTEPTDPNRKKYKFDF